MMLMYPSNDTGQAILHLIKEFIKIVKKTDSVIKTGEHTIVSVVDLGFGAWGGQREFQGGAKFTNLVN